MNKVILEIERVREIMGLNSQSKPLITENIGILAKLFRQADEVFSDVTQNKQIIKQLDELTPITKGTRRLTQKEIDDLATALSNDAAAIKAAMSNVSYDVGINAVKQIASVKKLNTLLMRTAREETDSLLNLFAEKQLAKVFDSPDGVWNSAYSQAITNVKNLAADYWDNMIKLPEDELIQTFKSELNAILEKKIKGFKWEDYPEFQRWASNEFNRIDGTLDDIIKKTLVDDDGSFLEAKAYTVKSNNRFETFNAAKLETETNLELKDIKARSLTNFRAIHGIVSKLKSIFTKGSGLTSFEKNVALLKGFPVDQMFKTVNNKVLPNDEFVALVKNVGLDIEQVATYEKNVLKQWQDLMKEIESINPELAKGMQDVPIYSQSGGGLIWVEEKLSVFLDRLKLMYEGQLLEGGGFGGFLIEQLKQAIQIVTLGSKSIITSTKSIMDGGKGFLSAFAKRQLFSGGVWGVPFTPKQVGLMLTRRGFAPVQLLKSFLESWFAMFIWQRVLQTLVAVFQPIFVWICELTVEPAIGKLFDKNFSCTDDKRSMVQFWSESIISIWLDYTSYLEFPFKPGFLIDIGEKIFNGLTSVDSIDQTSIELPEDNQKKFNELWGTLGPDKQKFIVEKMAKQENTDFQNFYQVIDKAKFSYQYNKFLEINGLDDNDVQKIKSNIVATVPEKTKLGVSIEQLKNLTADSPNISSMFNVGAIKDKSGKVYTIKKLDDVFHWEFIPPDEYILFGVQPVGNDDKFYIYRDDSDKEPILLNAEALKKEGFNKGYDENGYFTSKIAAENVKKSLQLTYPSIPQNPISIQELLKKL